MDRNRGREEGKGLYDLGFGSPEVPLQIPRHWLLRRRRLRFRLDRPFRGEGSARAFSAYYDLAARSPVLLHVLAGHIEKRMYGAGSVLVNLALKGVQFVF